MSQSTCPTTNRNSSDVGQRLLVNPRLLVHMLSQELFPAPTDYLTGWLMIRKCVADRLGCSNDTAGSLVDLLEGKGFLRYMVGPEGSGSVQRQGHWEFVPDADVHRGHRRLVRSRAS